MTHHSEGLSVLPSEQLSLLEMESDPQESICLKFPKLLMPPRKGLRHCHRPSPFLGSYGRRLGNLNPALPFHFALKCHVGYELPYLGALEFSQMNSKAFCHSEFLAFFTAVFGILLALQGTIKFTVTLVT